MPPSAPPPDPLTLGTASFASAADSYERGRPGYPSADGMRTRFDGDPHFSAFTHWTGSHQVATTEAVVEDMVASRTNAYCARALGGPCACPEEVPWSG